MSGAHEEPEHVTPSLPAATATGERALDPAHDGLVFFTYVGTHLLNHALGNVSLAWLERDLLVQKFIWQGWLGTVVLYTSLVTHFCLGLWALEQQGSTRWYP